MKKIFIAFFMFSLLTACASNNDMSKNEIPLFEEGEENLMPPENESLDTVVEIPPPARSEGVDWKNPKVIPKTGFYKTTTKKCSLKSKPSEKSKSLGSVPKGRKLWVESAGKYFKVNRKKDVAYLSQTCF